MKECIFCKIVHKEIASQLIYEDDAMVAFYDIHPKADIHFLIIPKLHLTSMLELEESHVLLMGNLMLLANRLAKQFGLEGYKVQINAGEKGGQEVFHLHVHVLGNK
jgi:histidine triad (HIT) family protein